MQRLIRTLAASSILVWVSGCSGSDEGAAVENEAYLVDDPGYTEEVYADESGVDGSGLTYYGYDCTQDCSGHEAGYAWAEENYITNPDDCGGDSQSFIEGCIAYAEENGGGF